MSDSGNHAIRMIVGEKASTVAGRAGEPGHQDSTRATTRFKDPQGVGAYAEEAPVFEVVRWQLGLFLEPRSTHSRFLIPDLSALPLPPHGGTAQSAPSPFTSRTPRIIRAATKERPGTMFISGTSITV